MFQDRISYIRLTNKIIDNLKFRTISNLNIEFICKIQLSYQLHLCYATKKWPDLSQSTNNYLHQINLKKILQLARDLITLSPRFIYYKIFRRFSQKEILLVGYKKHNKSKNNQNVNQYLEPFINTHNQIQSLIYYIDENSITDISFSYLNFLLKWYRTYHSLKAYVFYRKRFLSIGSDINKNLSEELGHKISGLDFFMANKFIEYLVYKASYKAWLKKIKPKEIIGYCYYDNTINALFGAGNSLNIKTKEYQHSNISNRHFAYSKWHNVDGITNHFPKIFMVWDYDDKTLIEKNFVGEKYFPNVEVTDILHLEATDSLKRDITDSKNILICLQGLWIPKWMEDYIITDNLYEWYFRLHPRYPNDKERLNEFCNYNKSNIHISEGIDASFEEILVDKKILITGFSGTALEAHSNGINVIIYGVEGKKTYERFINNRVFFHAEEAVSFDKIIKEIIA